MFGTTDFAIIEPFGKIIIGDFKYGSGIVVDPKGNSQMAFYALGIAHLYDWNFSEIEFVIIQPRAIHEEGTVRRHTVTLEEMEQWKSVFELGVFAAEKKRDTFKAGEHCRFCPAKIVCPEISKKALSQAQIDFAPEKDKEIKLPDPQFIPIQNLNNILKAGKKLTTWIEAVEQYAYQTLQRGETVPGWKLVNKRGTRKWMDEHAVAQEAKDNPKAFKTELLSPAQMEKVMPKDWVSQRCHAVVSGQTLVEESDPREAYNSIEASFDAII